ncbi:MAG: hypothetical protein HYZ75_13595 [Elusimicrobia bacterium]|nr:hypothetical protein [Elusimicrobiota bacterium]
MRGLPLAFLLFPAAASGFDGAALVFPSGGVLKGVLLSDDGREVVLEVDGGTVEFSRDALAELRREPNAHSEFKTREAAAKTPAELWALARWASENGLPGWARQSAERVLGLELGHEDARAFLGYQLVGGDWRRGDALMSAKGYVRHGGRWLTRAERASALEEESREDELRRAAREESARLRELAFAVDRAVARRRPVQPVAAPVLYFLGRPAFVDALPRNRFLPAAMGQPVDRTWRPEPFQTYRPVLGLAPLDPVSSRFGLDPLR